MTGQRLAWLWGGVIGLVHTGNIIFHAVDRDWDATVAWTVTLVWFGLWFLSDRISANHVKALEATRTSNIDLLQQNLALKVEAAELASEVASLRRHSYLSSGDADDIYSID